MNNEVAGACGACTMLSCGAGGVSGLVVLGCAVEVAPFAAIAAVAWAVLSILGANSTAVAVGIAVPLSLAAPGIIIGAAAVAFMVLAVGFGVFTCGSAVLAAGVGA